MPTIRFLSKEVWVDKRLVQWVTDIMVIINLGLSLSIIVGGSVRFSRPSYQPLLEYSSGHVWLWAIWIGLSGFLITIPIRHVNIVGLWLAMVWYIIWASSFTIAVIRYEDAVATPIPVYGGLALLCAALLLAKVITVQED